MKHSILSFILVATPLLGFSQEGRINDAYNFTVGTHIKYRQCDATGVNPGPIGAKQTWDFSTLQPIQGNASEEIVKPVQTPDGSKFPSANVAEKFSDGSYLYVDIEKIQSKMVGTVSASNNITQYPKPVVCAKRPVMFGGSNSYPYTSKYTLNGMDYTGRGNVVLDANAYGTLILPGGKKYKKVVRIKITRKESDYSAQTKKTTITRYVTYEWFDDEHKAPLLKISTVSSPNSKSSKVEYLLSETDK